MHINLCRIAAVSSCPSKLLRGIVGTQEAELEDNLCAWLWREDLKVCHFYWRRGTTIPQQYSKMCVVVEWLAKVVCVTPRWALALVAALLTHSAPQKAVRVGDERECWLLKLCKVEAHFRLGFNFGDWLIAAHTRAGNPPWGRSAFSHNSRRRLKASSALKRLLVSAVNSSPVSYNTRILYRPSSRL